MIDVSIMRLCDEVRTSVDKNSLCFRFELGLTKIEKECSGRRELSAMPSEKKGTRIGYICNVEKKLKDLWLPTLLLMPNRKCQCGMSSKRKKDLAAGQKNPRC